MVILDTEEGTLPLRAIATYTDEGIADRFYGTMDKMNVSNNGKWVKAGTAILSVKVDSIALYAQTNSSDIYAEVKRALDAVLENRDMNSSIYDTMLNIDPWQHIENIKKFHRQINSAPLNQNFHFLDNSEFE